MGSGLSKGLARRGSTLTQEFGEELAQELLLYLLFTKYTCDDYYLLVSKLPIRLLFLRLRLLGLTFQSLPDD